jgi:hypothetical protein
MTIVLKDDWARRQGKPRKTKFSLVHVLGTAYIRGRDYRDIYRVVLLSLPGWMFPIQVCTFILTRSRDFRSGPSFPLTLDDLTKLSSALKEAVRIAKAHGDANRAGRPGPDTKKPKPQE